MEDDQDPFPLEWFDQCAVWKVANGWRRAYVCCSVKRTAKEVLESIQCLDYPEKDLCGPDIDVSLIAYKDYLVDWKEWKMNLLHERIKDLAFAKWEQAGHPHGRCEEFYYAAERELKSQEHRRKLEETYQLWMQNAQIVSCSPC